MKLSDAPCMLTGALLISALIATSAYARMPPLTRGQAKSRAYEYLDRLGGDINAQSELYDADYILGPLGHDERLLSFWKAVVTKSTSSSNATKAMANIHFMIWDAASPPGRKLTQKNRAIGDFLVQSLDHPNSEVRKRAICSLGHIPDPYESIGLRTLKAGWPESMTWCWGHSYGDKEWILTALSSIAESTSPVSARLEATKRLYEIWTSYINGTFPANAAMRENRRLIESTLLRLTNDEDDAIAYNAVKHFLVYHEHHPAELRAKLLIEFLRRPISPQDGSEKKDLFISAMIIGMDRSPISQLPAVRAAIKDATARGNLLGFYKDRLSKEYLSVQQAHEHVISRWESHLK